MKPEILKLQVFILQPSSFILVHSFHIGGAVDARTTRSSGTRISLGAAVLGGMTRLFSSRSAPIRPISRPLTATAVSGVGNNATGNTSLKQISEKSLGIRRPSACAAPT